MRERDEVRTEVTVKTGENDDGEGLKEVKKEFREKKKKKKKQRGQRHTQTRVTHK